MGDGEGLRARGWVNFIKMLHACIKFSTRFGYRLRNEKKNRRYQAEDP